MRNLLLLLMVGALPFLSFAQNTVESGKKVKSVVSSEYDRSSVTFIGLDFNENLSSKLYTQFAALQVPDKYYDNNVETKILKPGIARPATDEYLQQIEPEKIAEWLKENKVGQQILAKWFNRQADGTFNVDMLKERGMFNANDNDFKVASASKRGEASLMDMGLQLVDKSYVLVFDYYNVLSMNQYYTKEEIATDKRTMNGFKSSLNSYLFKLDFSELVAAEFFQKYWVSEGDADKQAKIDAFNNADFSFQFMSKQRTSPTATQYNEGQTLAPKFQKSEAELFDALCLSGLTSVTTIIENQQDAFKVKAMVSDVHPIAAKIGKKEGLKFDNRYFVYENRMRNNGSTYSKKVAVVKSMKIADNRKVTSGESESSEFYQIAGGKVDNYGMFLEQHNDVGLNICVGYNAVGAAGATVRAEYYISKVFGDLVGKGKSGKALTAWKIYVEGGFGAEAPSAETVDENFDFVRISGGIAKDFHPLPFLHWGPFVGYGIETGTWDVTEEQINSDFIEAGVRVGVNLASNVQLLGTASYHSLISSEIEEDGVVTEEDFQYEDFFEDRMGLGINIGLRIMF
ncbi:hypothetical protein [uncultured Draconibacterium sp.]|uniref:hypothetical protein n=1 Tax=uncultured Draconibacterium sp. TaxID=1573823 RepID=UPI0032162329